MIPIVLLVVVAAVDLGRAVFAYNTITNAAREAARLAVVNQDTTLITQRALNQTAIAETTAPNVTVTFKKPTPNADPATNATCTTIEIGCMAIVTYQTTYQPLTPIVSRIVFPLGVTLTTWAVMAVEYVCPNGTIAAAANCPKQP